MRPEAYRDAERLLARHGWHGCRVYNVDAEGDRDVILFRSGGHLRTATVEIRTEGDEHRESVHVTDGWG